MRSYNRSTYRYVLPCLVLSRLVLPYLVLPTLPRLASQQRCTYNLPPLISVSSYITVVISVLCFQFSIFHGVVFTYEYTERLLTQTLLTQTLPTQTLLTQSTCSSLILYLLAKVTAPTSVVQHAIAILIFLDYDLIRREGTV